MLLLAWHSCSTLLWWFLLNWWSQGRATSPSFSIHIVFIISHKASSVSAHSHKILHQNLFCIKNSELQAICYTLLSSKSISSNSCDLYNKISKELPPSHSQSSADRATFLSRFNFLLACAWLRTHLSFLIFLALSRRVPIQLSKIYSFKLFCFPHTLQTSSISPSHPFDGNYLMCFIVRLEHKPPLVSSQLVLSILGTFREISWDDLCK